MLTKDEVAKVAKLANLPILENELEKYTGDLSAILGYIEQLEKVDVADAVPMYNSTGLVNVESDDIVKPSLSQEEALQNAPHSKDGYFVTKGVFADE